MLDNTGHILASQKLSLAPMSDESSKSSLVGDAVFFVVLLFTFALMLSTVRAFFSLITEVHLESFPGFFVGMLVGAAIGHYLIRSYLSVLLHEVKHMIVSLLAGNKPKGILVKKSSGHFAYEYTEDTKSYNAFISLAPYYLPLFSTLLIGSLIYPLWGNMEALKLVLGMGYGIDLVISLRDISPRQTDFSALRGGFGLGILYIISIHVIIFLTIITWVGGDIDLLQTLFLKSFNLFVNREATNSVSDIYSYLFDGSGIA